MGENKVHNEDMKGQEKAKWSKARGGYNMRFEIKIKNNIRI